MLETNGPTRCLMSPTGIIFLSVDLTPDEQRAVEALERVVGKFYEFPNIARVTIHLKE